MALPILLIEIDKIWSRDITNQWMFLYSLHIINPLRTTDKQIETLQSQTTTSRFIFFQVIFPERRAINSTVIVHDTSKLCRDYQLSTKYKTIKLKIIFQFQYLA